MMAQIRSEVRVVLDPDTYHLIESLGRALATKELASNPATIEDGLRLCSLLLAQYSAHAATSDSNHTNSSKPLCNWREAKAKNLLAASMSEGMHIAEIAKECSLSRSHFSRAFKHSTGVSPKEWLITTRIRRAKEMLLGFTLPLADIAFECGFSDQSHFTRVFSKQVGTTPKRWRQQMVNAKSTAQIMCEI